ncbi:sulfatase-like hydrolase/transferase [Chitinibacter sp. GC72]|uniref:sulfatase-like hydrolase/transferase n=1 Tax=Chitinibacter sp. GC72 TaxID=1526917 RepID=UPI0012FA3EFE|nr:sulfatase-like hydrolase/transferase [Chitinibacter sp. GC72]
MIRNATCFLYELFLWIFFPFLFCLYYVLGHDKPWLALVEHIYFVIVVFSFFQVLKIILLRVLGSSAWIKVLNSMLQGTFLFLLLLYWLAVVALLNIWGRVITEEIIVSYSGQLAYFVEIFGYSLYEVAGLFFLVYGCFLIFFFYVGQVRTWEPAWFFLKIRFFGFFIFVVMMFFGKLIFDCFYFASDNLEPISTTLYSGKKNHLLTKFDQGLIVPDSVNREELLASEHYLPGVNKKNKNIIIIVVDALRFDHMSVYGYARKTTPYLDSLADLGILSIASNVRASCGESVCGLSSMAGSRYSHQMPNSPFSLSKVMLRNGYDVRMILSDNHLNTYSTSDLYGAVTQYYDGGMAAAYMSDDGHVLNALQGVKSWSGRPTMMQFHLMSAHQLGKKYPEFKKYIPAKGHAGKMKGDPTIENTNSYDNGVLQADDFIRKILSMLAEKNYLNDALVVITADHGDSLGEHGLFNHTNSVREQLLHIPLLMLNYQEGKASPGVRIDSFISQIDIAPSILFELGIERPSVWEGNPFQIYKKKDFTYFQMVPSIGLYDHRNDQFLWKYWIDNSNNIEYVFDLISDPAENNNKIQSVDRVLLSQWREKIRAVNYERK